MLELKFRIYFGGTSATVEELAHIDEITVDQAEDIAWEARIVMAHCLDANGRWSRQDQARFAPRTQVRIELKMGTDDFKPLIEGPIVSVDNALDSRPGRSTATIVVHDDSAWLNQTSAASVLTDRPDNQIAEELFTTGSSNHVTTPDVVLPAASPPSLGEQFAHLGTPMQKLRYLARRNGCRTYVLPGAIAGQSVGCMKGDPEGNPVLPPLVLLGSARNLVSVNATEDPEVARRSTSHTLRLSDQQTGSYTTGVTDDVLLGPRAAAAAPAERTLSPTASDSEDPAARTAAEARLRNYPVRYTGTLIPGAYPKILQPFQKVMLNAGATTSSATILVTKVTHRITPSVYSVNFEGRGNSLAELGAPTGTPAGIV